MYRSKHVEVLMNKWNSKFRYQVASFWLFILSYTTMHGSMNIKKKSRAIPLPPYGPYGLYKASVPVQGYNLPLPYFKYNFIALLQCSVIFVEFRWLFLDIYRCHLHRYNIVQRIQNSSEQPTS